MESFSKVHQIVIYNIPENVPDWSFTYKNSMSAIGFVIGSE